MSSFAPDHDQGPNSHCYSITSLFLTVYALLGMLTLAAKINHLTPHVAALVYDELLTIAMAVQFIWTPDFTGATLIFFVNRYFTLVSLLLVISTSLVHSMQVRNPL